MNIRAKAVCVCRDGDRILVGPGTDAVKGQTFYGPLGGGVEFGERAADAIRREMLEELGVELGEVVLQNRTGSDSRPSGCRSTTLYLADRLCTRMGSTNC
jgi:ADP-ribose pyrophosphatase YjhB (NUDIX family)